jgi:uncharacterized protein YegL
VIFICFYGISALLHLSSKPNLMKPAIFLLLLMGCCTLVFGQPGNKAIKTIGDIPLPAGYQRVSQNPGSFGAWLRQIPLKKDKTVYLYNGKEKFNQLAQFAVLDISVGNKDLQQCADAVMRLYAEYRYSHAQYQQISFKATDGTPMDYNSWMKGYRYVIKQSRLNKQLSASACGGRACFDSYLQTVFSFAGTLSLSRDLQEITDISNITPGDVFIKGGSPGHAVIVADVAYRIATGEKVFLLAQSYMPAQDIHVLKTPGSVLSPWYSTAFTGNLYTPEWIFQRDQLKRFK